MVSEVRVPAARSATELRIIGIMRTTPTASIFLTRTAAKKHRRRCAVPVPLFTLSSPVLGHRPGRIASLSQRERAPAGGHTNGRRLQGESVAKRVASTPPMQRPSCQGQHVVLARPRANQKESPLRAFLAIRAASTSMEVNLVNFQISPIKSKACETRRRTHLQAFDFQGLFRCLFLDQARRTAGG